MHAPQESNEREGIPVLQQSHAVQAQHRSRSSGSRYSNSSHHRHTSKRHTPGSSHYKRPYNPVRISSTTYIGDHNPKGVHFHGDKNMFTWKLDHKRYAKQQDMRSLTRNKSATIPGYSQYIARHQHGVPFCCWVLLCCGLCIPCCCCCCCDYDDMDETEKQIEDTIPLIVGNKLNKKNNNNKHANIIDMNPKPMVEPVSNFAYPSYQSIGNGQSVNQNI